MVETRAVLAVLALVVAAATGAIVGKENVGRWGPSSAASAARVIHVDVDGLSTGVQQQLATATPVRLGTRWVEAPVLPLSIAVQYAPIIAEVRVTDIYPAFFNTLSGEPPPVPTEANPLEDNHPGWEIYRIAELQVLTMYKGDPELDVILTVIHGGTRSGYAQGVGGKTIHEFEAGSRAMVFIIYDGYDAPASSAHTDIPWLYHAGLRKEALLGANVNAVFHSTDYAFLYDVGQGTAMSNEYGGELTITDLRSQVEALLH